MISTGVKLSRRMMLNLQSEHAGEAYVDTSAYRMASILSSKAQHLYKQPPQCTPSYIFNDRWTSQNCLRGLPKVRGRSGGKGQKETSILMIVVGLIMPGFEICTLHQ